MIAACMLKCTWSLCTDFVLCVLGRIDLDGYLTTSLDCQNKQRCHSGAVMYFLCDFYDSFLFRMVFSEDLDYRGE